MKVYIWSSGETVYKSPCVNIVKKRVRYMADDGLRDGYEYYDENDICIGYAEIEGDGLYEAIETNVVGGEYAAENVHLDIHIPQKTNKRESSMERMNERVMVPQHVSNPFFAEHSTEQRIEMESTFMRPIDSTITK
jgi:hypothetical protein